MPCIINYTFIAKFENLAAESERLLKYFQRNRDPHSEKIHFPEKLSRFNITEQVVRDMWKQIPEEKIERIRKLYQDDFLFYNYDPYLYRGDKSSDATWREAERASTLLP